MIARVILVILMGAGLLYMGVAIGEVRRDQQDTYDQVGWCMKRDRLP